MPWLSWIVQSRAKACHMCHRNTYLLVPKLEVTPLYVQLPLQTPDGTRYGAA